MQGARSLLNVPIGTWVRIRYVVPIACCTRRPIGRSYGWDRKNRSSVPHQTLTDVSVATIAKHCKWLNHFSGCFPGLIAIIMHKHVYNTKKLPYCLFDSKQCPLILQECNSKEGRFLRPSSQTYVAFASNETPPIFVLKFRLI